MLPDDKRMLVGARKTVYELSAGASSADQAALSSIDAVLVEFLLRANRTFYVNHHRLGRELANDGLVLCQAYKFDSEEITQHVGQLQELNSEQMHADDTWQHIDQLRNALQLLVFALAVPEVEKKQDVEAYLALVVDWENQFHALHSQFAAAEQQSEQTDYFTQQNLEAYLTQKFPEWTGISVGNIKVLPGGFSKKTVLFDVTDSVNGSRSLVIRAESPPRFDFWEGDQVKNEYVILQLVHEAGLCVAEPLWLEEDKQYLGQPFLVSCKAEGENVGSAKGADGRISKGMLEDLVRNLVAIHSARLNPEDTRLKGSYLQPWLQFKTLTESTAAWIEHWADAITRKQLRASPLMARTLAWLRNNVPVTDEAPSMLHGDYGLHNVLVEGYKVSCILDWEYLTFGDPAEDIALLSLSMGGQVSKAEIMALYEGFGGKPISEYRLRYFDVLYALKFILPCENALNLYQHNEQANVNLCQFGFQYTYAGVATLNDKIVFAEQALKQI